MKETKNIIEFIQPTKIEVPSSDYFENLANEIIAQKNQTPTKVIPFYKKPLVRWIAAAAVILPFVFYFTFQNESKDSENVLANLNNISKEDIHAYIMENEEDFHIDEIIEATDLVSIENFSSKAVTLNSTIEPSFFDGLSKEEIESYFDYSNEDLENLDEDVFI